jgi:hypothetical protein
MYQKSSVGPGGVAADAINCANSPITLASGR